MQRLLQPKFRHLLPHPNTFAYVMNYDMAAIANYCEPDGDTLLHKMATKPTLWESLPHATALTVQNKFLSARNSHRATPVMHAHTHACSYFATRLVDILEIQRILAHAHLPKGASYPERIRKLSCTTAPRLRIAISKKRYIQNLSPETIVTNINTYKNRELGTYPLSDDIAWHIIGFLTPPIRGCVYSN